VLEKKDGKIDARGGLNILLIKKRTGPAYTNREEGNRRQLKKEQGEKKKVFHWRVSESMGDGPTAESRQRGPQMKSQNRLMELDAQK